MMADDDNDNNDNDDNCDDNNFPTDNLGWWWYLIIILLHQLTLVTAWCQGALVISFLPFLLQIFHNFFQTFQWSTSLLLMHHQLLLHVNLWLLNQIHLRGHFIGSPSATQHPLSHHCIQCLNQFGTITVCWVLCLPTTVAADHRVSRQWSTFSSTTRLVGRRRKSFPDITNNSCTIIDIVRVGDKSILAIKKIFNLRLH